MSELEKIRKLLELEKPGWNAQKLMSPVKGGEPYRDLPENHLKASVTLLLYPEKNSVQSIFIERSYHPDDKHSGQISLPGGKVEANENFLEAARRELEEEIGVPGSLVEYLGELSPLYVYVSNFLVQPFVAWVPEKPFTNKQDDEVDSILHVDLETFQLEKYIKNIDLRVRQMTLKNVPYFDLDGKILWGATAMIMSEFSSLMTSYNQILKR